MQSLHYSAAEDNFILVYTAREARFVSSDLTFHECIDTKQSTIFASTWYDNRQELVTSGSDGSLHFFATQKHYKVTLTGRLLIPSFVPRMSIWTDRTWPWMAVLCVDEVEGRLFAVNQTDVLLWSCSTGELLQTFPNLHEVSKGRAKGTPAPSAPS